MKAKKLPGKPYNALALPPSKSQSYVYNVQFSIDGLPRMVLDLELMGRRAGGKHSHFKCNSVEAKINGKPIIGHRFTRKKP